MVFLALLLALMRPCKSATANFSLSYHAMIVGILSVYLTLWKSDQSMDTFALELVCIIVPAVSHVLVFLWAGYQISCWAVSRWDMSPCVGILVDLAAAVKDSLQAKIWLRNVARCVAIPH